MPELLDHLALLTSPALDLNDLRLDGVAFGSATTDFPREKICEVTFSPIVSRHRSGTNIESEYFDSQGRRISRNDVIDSVISTSGMVHFASKISFKIVAGRIVGFALYGDSLRRFDYMKTYARFCREFGPADRVVENVTYGNLMGYKHYYFGSRKRVTW